MELEPGMVSPEAGVPTVIESEVVTTIRGLLERGWGKKRIAHEVGISINTVRRYVRQPVVPGVQVRPGAQRLTDAVRAQAQAWFTGPAAGNAVVVQRLLRENGLVVS